MERIWRIVIKHGNPFKNHDGLCTLEGYRHLLPIIRYKHQRYQGGMLMADYSGMRIRSQKGIKMKMETTIGLWQGEWNYLQTFALCRIVPCFEWQLLLHVLSFSKHIAPNLYELDWQWQCLPLVMTISICLCMVGEKVGSLSLCVNSTFQNDSCNNISECIMGCNAFTLGRAM